MIRLRIGMNFRVICWLKLAALSYTLSYLLIMNIVFLSFFVYSSNKKNPAFDRSLWSRLIRITICSKPVLYSIIVTISVGTVPDISTVILIGKRFHLSTLTYHKRPFLYHSFRLHQILYLSYVWLFLSV